LTYEVTKQAAVARMLAIALGAFDAMHAVLAVWRALDALMPRIPSVRSRA
jgi:hypothetical protein